MPTWQAPGNLIIMCFLTPPLTLVSLLLQIEQYYALALATWQRLLKRAVSHPRNFILDKAHLTGRPCMGDPPPSSLPTLPFKNGMWCRSRGDLTQFAAGQLHGLRCVKLTSRCVTFSVFIFKISHYFLVRC
jgi:hypothetical protein